MSNQMHCHNEANHKPHGVYWECDDCDYVAQESDSTDNETYSPDAQHAGVYDQADDFSDEDQYKEGY